MLPAVAVSDHIYVLLLTATHVHGFYNPSTVTFDLLYLPYLPGKTFYRLALRPPMGPMRIPERAESTTMLQNPQV